ncbi:hypothetical protein CXIVA_03730 [Clostridium sp. SY8519]|nr:hypothetical protein CXIVA_03730 [Clostridium sp. SY8519]
MHTAGALRTDGAAPAVQSGETNRAEILPGSRREKNHLTIRGGKHIIYSMI